MAEVTLKFLVLQIHWDFHYIRTASIVQLGTLQIKKNPSLMSGVRSQIGQTVEKTRNTIQSHLQTKDNKKIASWKKHQYHCQKSVQPICLCSHWFQFALSQRSCSVASVCCCCSGRCFHPADAHNGMQATTKKKSTRNKDLQSSFVLKRQQKKTQCWLRNTPQLAGQGAQHTVFSVGCWKLLSVSVTSESRTESSCQ